MAVSYGREHLLNYDSGVPFLNASLQRDLIVKFTTRAYFCDKVIPVIVFIKLINFYDIGMIQSFEQFNLMSESLELKVIQILLFENLNCSYNLRSDVLTFSDFAVCT